MKTLPIIQSLWIGEKLSVMEELCISSFLQNGHPFHLYVYDNVKNIPDQTVLKDASEILGPDRIFKYKDHDSYGGFANLFRYKLLLEKGSYWVDTDVICLKPFLDEAEYVFAGEQQLNPETNAPSANKFKAANCVIKTPVGSSIMDYCYRESNNKDPQSLHWGQTGPQLLTKAITDFDLWSYVADSEVFCPINWWQWSQFINEQPDNNALKKAQSIHLWNEMWRRNNIDKSDNFDINSIYEQLKKTYLKQ
jgi:hypothetical protein